MSRKEPATNIQMLCDTCVEKRRKHAQKLLKGKPIKVGMFVKLGFKEGDMVEHMWVQITEVKARGFVGVVDNIPAFITKPKYKDKVTFKRSEVEDLLDPARNTP